jgi:GTP diphosphokinase / guanosine-3',5'-bis(diphosphate) 3'-diphosphatase
MVVADRERRWRRPPSHDPVLDPLLETFRKANPKERVDRIIAAYDLAAAAHSDQSRSSGEKYINHPLSVARIVAGMGMDEETVVAALIHDVVEDTHVSLYDVEQRFGPMVALLVDGVTKIDRLSFDSKEEQQAATMRKMVVAMARDVRVLILKLADRLHNMRTIAGVPAEKQSAKANETLEIYVPLANRLGMQDLRQELEDLSFAAMYPKRYAELDYQVAARTPELDQFIIGVVSDFKEKLTAAGIDATLTWRTKNLWGIHEKMQMKDKPFKEIFDLIAVRVVVREKPDCYAALGIIHSTYKAIEGRFKDYISNEKFNNYQSLHTTVLHPDGRPVEVQIRTTSMHETAERGVAAHWRYKSGSVQDELSFLSRLADRPDVVDPIEYMAEIQRDIEQEEITVFTPKGKAVILPRGSTPIDFAYAVHTEIGNRCIAARVNGELVRLDSELTTGQICQIVPSQVGGAPSKQWLDFVVTSRARHKIRQWFSRERRSDQIEQGRDDVTDVLRAAGLPIKEILEGPLLAAQAVALGHEDVEDLFLAIGSETLDPKVLVEPLLKALRTGADGVMLSSRRSVNRRREPGEVGIHVEGFEGVMVRLSRCCTPVPGDEIIGFLTRGRGISVHRTDCSNAGSLEQVQNIRFVDVEWDARQANARFVASVDVHAFDRTGLLRDVADAMAMHEVNIVSCTSNTDLDRITRMRFEIDMADPAHLSATLRGLSAIDDVYDAFRTPPGGTVNGAKLPGVDR